MPSLQVSHVWRDIVTVAEFDTSWSCRQKALELFVGWVALLQPAQSGEFVQQLPLLCPSLMQAPAVRHHPAPGGPRVWIPCLAAILLRHPAHIAMTPTDVWDEIGTLHEAEAEIVSSSLRQVCRVLLSVRSGSSDERLAALSAAVRSELGNEPVGMDEVSLASFPHAGQLRFKAVTFLASLQAPLDDQCIEVLSVLAKIRSEEKTLQAHAVRQRERQERAFELLVTASTVVDALIGCEASRSARALRCTGGG
jgi:hypothetical protein